MNNTKKATPLTKANEAGKYQIHSTNKGSADSKSRQISPEDVENHKLGSDRLIKTNSFGLPQAELYKSCLVSVTKTLKSYAETFHFHVHSKEIPFVTCQDPLCVQACKEIDYVILIVAGGSR